MPAGLIFLDPPPPAAEIPSRFPSPFQPGAPVPLARRAADELQQRLRAGLPGVDLAALDAPGGGKMFGVLVVATPDGRIGSLSAFSGMLAGRWHVDGFAPPRFDPVARDRFWPAAEAELAALERRHRELVDGADAVARRAAVAELSARHEAALAALRARHRERKERRAAARARLASAADDDADASALHALAQESRGDAAERRRLDADHERERASATAALAELEAARAELEVLRAARSRAFWQQILDGYAITSARGERRSLAALFAPDVPPGGAGDCAAPKLLGHAYQHRLRPLALAEFWWGAPPVTGGRLAGHYYPACRGKCGPILRFMLDGLDADPVPLFGAAAIPADEPRAVFEDPWLIVVDKPCGLLSVPGRHARLRDSVLVRLQARFPDATGPLVVHRLDLDTSGLLLAARDPDTHAALQRSFARREIDKRYVAWLDGAVASDAGVIELPLRVDLDDRPRQIYDPVHGKPAVTEWRVLERSGNQTKVALFPRTGRTHQLRLHAAHPLGLGAPIVGDRLYGRDGARLLLHAEALAFTHPRTGERIQLECPAPF